ncbi:MAG: hypothetical protein ACP5NP_12960 [Acetobacteraceae bacterium]
MNRLLLATVILALPLAAQAARVKHPRAPALPGYTTLTAAKSACGASPVVWRAHDSRVFHLASSRYFGKTKRGAYVCEQAAEAKGLRAAKS